MVTSLLCARLGKVLLAWKPAWNDESHPRAIVTNSAAPQDRTQGFLSHIRLSRGWIIIPAASRGAGLEDRLYMTCLYPWASARVLPAETLVLYRLRARRHLPFGGVGSRTASILHRLFREEDLFAPH